ncbi:MAG: hypothetical protein ACLFN8_03495 [Candidatus Woesearchaeota archaeon]
MNIQKYNDIIRNNPRGTRQLEKEGKFPIKKINFNMPFLTKDQYNLLVDWSSEENAAYLNSCLYNFEKKWIINNNYSTTPLTTILIHSNKQDKLIKSLAELTETQHIDVDTMNFFKSLEEQPYKNNLEANIYLIDKEYAVQRIRHNLVSKHSDGYFCLNLWQNKLEYVCN